VATVLLSIAILGVCFALLAIRLLFVKDSKFPGICGRTGKADEDPCMICPRAKEKGGAQVCQEPKSSNAIFSLGTPKSSSVVNADCNKAGGPQR